MHTEQVVVSIFGDVAGYQTLCQLLEGAKKTNKPRILEFSDQHETMQCVVTPAQKTEADKPFLLIPERLVYRNKRPVMELVIAGNAKGYDLLIYFIEKSIKDGEDHLGVKHRWIGENLFWENLAYLSVILNIHPPLKKWDVRKLLMFGFEEVVKAGLEELLPEKFRKLRGGDYVPVNLRHYRLRK